MKNKEMFAREIVDIATGGNGMVAIDKNTGKLVGCSELGCKNCAFSSEKGCDDARKAWAEAEYKEPLSAKTVADKFRTFCGGKDCRECKYANSVGTIGCQIHYVFDNYDVKEKEIKNEK